MCCTLIVAMWCSRFNPVSMPPRTSEAREWLPDAGRKMRNPTF